ncbi:HU family DNA-binding protein [Rheinheimera soli]|jgi:DNA-binding protein HU-beta|uniref:HU family DNA-binding protein n=1 Tax=Rheinheimera soli TaxID=443616 RepID=UPI001E614C6F|nr:HU family DNA-binding protein [Rheinheimera soli]
MKKAQLVEKIAFEADITLSEAQAALNALLCSITNALRTGDNVALVGFGTFENRTRAARSGRNPKTGQPIHIATSHIPVFKAGKVFKDAIN